MSIIVDTVIDHLPSRRKITPSKWISFNCIACTHMGTSQDYRQRAGILIGTDEISYSCFNCGFKAKWQHGRLLSGNFKKLLLWLDVPNDKILQCVKESLLLKEDIQANESYTLMPKFFNRTLPKDAKPIKEWIKGPFPDKLINILEYIQSRSLYIDDYNWYWSNHHGYEDRLIIPFTYYNNRIVGYTARSINPEVHPRYISEQQPGYVFNIDKQTPDKKFIIVMEGPIDAISIGGVSLLGSTVSGGQHLIINQLQKDVIVIPDRDYAGKKLIETAINMGWSVSFPEWDDTVKDVNDAIKKYGRLYTLYSIIQGKKSDTCAIRIMENIWFKNEQR